MKKTLIIYDSYFGNTEKIARAMSTGLDEPAVLKAGEVTPVKLTEFNLLIVGSPTRGFSATPATMKLLKSLPPNALKGVQVAAFDTRFTEEEIASSVFFLKYFVKMFGYAAESIAKQLTRKGGECVLPAEGFFVKGTEGPLIEGELERAVNWARNIKAGR